jgi:hypothetical protein
VHKCISAYVPEYLSACVCSCVAVHMYVTPSSLSRSVTHSLTHSVTHSLTHSQVAASHFKAQCFGCDIDIRVLRGSMHAGVRVPTKTPHSTHTHTHSHSHSHSAADTVTVADSLPSPPPPTTTSVSEDVVQEGGSTHSHTHSHTHPKKRKKGVCTRKLQGDITRSIWDNFRAYGLPRPEVMRMDNHLFAQHCRASVVEGMFDAIVTDPPVSE